MVFFSTAVWSRKEKLRSNNIYWHFWCHIHWEVSCVNLATFLVSAAFQSASGSNSTPGKVRSWAYGLINIGVESEEGPKRRHGILSFCKSTFAGGQWGHERPKASEKEAAARRRNARWQDISCPNDLRSEIRESKLKSFSELLMWTSSLLGCQTKTDSARGNCWWREQPRMQLRGLQALKRPSLVQL